MLSELEKLEAKARLCKAKSVLAEQELNELRTAQKLDKIKQDIANQNTAIETLKLELGE